MRLTIDVNFRDAGFEESAHPRGEGGQFASAGGWKAVGPHEKRGAAVSVEEDVANHPHTAREYEAAFNSHEDAPGKVKALNATKKRLIREIDAGGSRHKDGPVDRLHGAMVNLLKTNYMPKQTTAAEAATRMKLYTINPRNRPGHR